MDIILIPGLWLDGSTWDRVTPSLEDMGHRPHPVTLPGMESKDADRSNVTLADLVGAVTDVIGSCSGRVVVVGHSAGSGVAYAAVDALPDRVARVMYIGGFPTPDGDVLAPWFTPEKGEITLPDWSNFDEPDLVGLDEALRIEFVERAIPSPGCFSTDPQRLSNDRRYDVAVTVICPEFTSEDLRNWVGGGAEPVRELSNLKDLTYVDLPTGHWPQFSRPTDLARVIGDQAAR